MASEGDVRQVAFVHDEIQSLVRNGLEEEVKQLGKDSIKRAGSSLSSAVPQMGIVSQGLTGEKRIEAFWVCRLLARVDGNGGI